MVTHDNDLARAVSRTIVLSDGEIIEEYLARALPTLSEAELARVTHHLEPAKFPPGAVIIRRGDTIERFCIVTRGHVDVFVQREGGREFVVSTMSRGQFFGEIELLSGGPAIATIRASSDEGAEVASLNRTEFQELLRESETVREAIQRIAEERIVEHRAAEARRAEGS
jgi:CRP-like cAMP-binding protein